jgi:hypothetical protein
MSLFRSQLVDAHYRPHQKLDAIALRIIPSLLTNLPRPYYHLVYHLIDIYCLWYTFREYSPGIFSKQGKALEPEGAILWQSIGQ